MLRSPPPHPPLPHTQSSSPPSSRVCHISMVYSVRKKNKCTSCLSPIIKPMYLLRHYPLSPPKILGFCVKPPAQFAPGCCWKPWYYQPFLIKTFYSHAQLETWFGESHVIHRLIRWFFTLSQPEYRSFTEGLQLTRQNHKVDKGTLNRRQNIVVFSLKQKEQKLKHIPASVTF